MANASGTIMVPLPRHLGLAQLIALRTNWPSSAESIRVVLHPEQWVEPSGLVGLACLIDEARRAGVLVTVDHQQCNRASYWERMGFFRQVGIEGPLPSGVPQEARKRFAEIRKVTDIFYVDDLTEESISVTEPPAEARRTFSHIVAELMNNVCQHSASYGFSAAQYWPASDKVQFCIADMGCGLKEALTPRYKPVDDLAAIELALQVGVTSRPPNFAQPHMRNRGVGLSCAHRLVTANNGTIEVWSRNGLFTNRSGIQSCDACWTGTLVAVTMRRENLAADFSVVMRELTTELYKIETEQKAKR